MNANQFTEFTRQLFVAFPSFLGQLSDKSPDLKATMEVWFSVLGGVEFSEALFVLGDWTHGRREPPKAYEYDRIALVVRASAMFTRDKGRQESDLQRRAREKREANGTRKAMFDYGIDRAYVNGVTLTQKLKNNEVTQMEFNEQLAVIISEVR